MKTVVKPWKLLLIILLSFALIESCKKNDTLTKIIPEELSIKSAYKETSFPHTKQYPADVATAWFTLLTDITKTQPYNPPLSLRIFAYSGMALYESVAPGMPSYQSMYKYFTGNVIDVDPKKDYYWPACANATIARIASRIMLDFSFPNLTSIQALESSFNVSFQSAASPEQLLLSNDFGKYVADKIYDWSKTNGTINPNGTASCPPYVPLGGAGNWEPTPPGFFPALGHCQVTLRTFIPNIVNIVLAAPPPNYSTDPLSEFHQAANEVFESTNNIIPDKLRQVTNWRGIVGNYNAEAHALRITTNIIRNENLNLEDATVIFAKQTIAAFDANIALFKSKYQYALISPITYIRNVMGYASWNSTSPTGQHPSYPDELSETASTVAILEDYFGTNYSFVDSTQNPLYGKWSYSSLNSLLVDLIQNKVSAGFNFRFSGEAGVIQGRLVGKMIDQLPFKK